MFLRFPLSAPVHTLLIGCLTLTLVCSGCSSAGKKKGQDEAESATGEKKKKQPERDALPNMSGDMAFQGFVGRLRTAVERQDRAIVASMMTPNFGWRWDDPPAGETPFTYWDQNQLWPELSRVLSAKFVSHEGYMVSPPEFVTDPNYDGYRCGMAMVNGSWRFAYFVGGRDILQ